MRIVAGKYRGRKLLELQEDGVRPTLDRVRENLFNILFKKVFGSNFLDLFTGSGAIGIEAISRGAKSVTFADKNPKVLSNVQKNVHALGENARYLLGEYTYSLRKLNGEKFDVIYLDPPYDFDPKRVLTHVVESGIVDQNTVIVYEHDNRKTIEPIGELVVYDERKYGIAVLTFLRIRYE